MSRRAAPRVTRKHLARAERDRIQKKRILIFAIATMTFVVGILVYGWYDLRVIQPNTPVAVVNGVEISGQEFQGRVRLEQLDLIRQYQQLQQYVNLFGGPGQAPASLQQQFTETELVLRNKTLQGQKVLDELISEILIEEEAAKRGLAITQAELDQAISNEFMFFPEGTPTPLPTATVNATALAELPASPTPTAGPSLTPTIASTPFPTATPYTLEAFESNYDSLIESLKELGIEEQDYLDRIEVRLLQDKLIASFDDQIPTEADHIWLENVILESRERAEEVLAELEAGRDWEELRDEIWFAPDGGYRGGDLGWLTSEDLILRYGAAYQAIAFTTEVMGIGGPVEMAEGWHLMRILGHESRPLSEAGLSRARLSAFNSWLESQLEQAEIEITEGWQDRVPDLPFQVAEG